MSLGDSQVLEPEDGSRGAFVPVFLSVPSDEPVVLTFHAASGSATEGEDFARWGTATVPRTVTIPAGALQGTINVPVLADDEVEDDETFTVVASAVSGGGAELGGAIGTATIHDSDAPGSPLPLLAVTGGRIVEGDEGVRKAQFHLQLSRPVGSVLSVAYQSVDGTASSPGDYTSKLPGTVTFTPGMRLRVIDVQVPADTTVDGDLEFGLEVVVAGGAPVEELSTSAVTVIEDDDAANLPPVADLSVTPSSGVAPLTVQLDAGQSADPDGSVASVSIDPGDGSPSVAGTTATHTYGPGTWTATVTVTDDVGTTDTASVTVTVLAAPRFTQLEAGDEHVCAVVEDGTARCWGDNGSGRLGTGSEADRSSSPRPVVGLEDVVDISAGSSHSCAVLADGGVRCWGSNSRGQLGTGTTTSSDTPVAVTGISSAVQVQTTIFQTCALLSEGTVACWGDNNNGQLGNGTTIGSDVPVPVSNLSGVVRIDSGLRQFCALRSDGTVWCWGYNTSGQLGTGTTSLRQTTPVQALGVVDATHVATGDSRTCAGVAGGGVWCWGNGNPTPGPLAGLTGVVSTSIELGHVCHTMVDGTARCWGRNFEGQLGDGTSTDRSTPQTVPGLGGVGAAVTGHRGTCALIQDGTARCWGKNDPYGQVGDGTTTDRPTPVAVVPPIDPAQLPPAPLGPPAILEQVSVGSDRTCAIRPGGQVVCWGRNDDGELGDGTTNNSRVPVDAGVVDAVDVATSAGGHHTCAVLTAGSVRCWGRNDLGQLGDGTTTGSLVPVEVAGVTGAVAVVTGARHSCALVAGGTARCWGAGGRLGDGTNTGSSTPVPVSGITGAVELTAAGEHTCARLATGTLRCWGENSFGKLGDGTTTTRTAPVAVSGLTAVTSVSAGTGHTCATRSDGGTWCWGNNVDGKVGLVPDSPLSPSPHPLPIQVPGVSAGTVATAGRSTCAVSTIDGEVLCWGYQWGVGSSHVPSAQPGISAAVGVGGAGRHSCAALVDGTARCWGFNGDGQLGSGDDADSVTPVVVRDAPA